MIGQWFDYRSEQQRHEKFVGRLELLAHLDRLLVDGEGDRRVAINGGPGMGTSAILVEWLARREATSARVPHYFIRRGLSDRDDPAQLAGSLVAQIEERSAALREPEADTRMYPAAQLDPMLSRAPSGKTFLEVKHLKLGSQEVEADRARTAERHGGGGEAPRWRFDYLPCAVARAPITLGGARRPGLEETRDETSTPRDMDLHRVDTETNTSEHV